MALKNSPRMAGQIVLGAFNILLISLVSITCAIWNEQAWRWRNTERAWVVLSKFTIGFLNFSRKDMFTMGRSLYSVAESGFDHRETKLTRDNNLKSTRFNSVTNINMHILVINNISKHKILITITNNCYTFVKIYRSTCIFS